MSVTVIFLLILSGMIPAAAQSSGLQTYILEKHGFDQNLVNGVLYYEKYKNVLNHPFYKGEDLQPGSVVVSGTTYAEVRINYDIYSQHVVLEYPVISGRSYKIILHPEHTEAFYFGGHTFEKLNLDEHGPRIYQCIRVNGLACYIHWEKKRETRSYQFSEYFTEPRRSFFLEVDGITAPFSNRRSFVSLIPGVPKKEINRYLRKDIIPLSDRSPEQLKEILQFISSRMQATNGK